MTTPVVIAFVSDPIGLGIVESRARPGANFSGVTYGDAVLGDNAVFGRRKEIAELAVANRLPSSSKVT